MMKREYKRMNLRQGTLDLIRQANDIIDEYQEQGYELTLRQLYYQFVARGLIPNTEREYKRIGGIISDGRLAGLIDWNAIVDRTRKHNQCSHWDSPADILQVVADSYAMDTRADQSQYIEVWVEKEALAGVLETICTQLDITWFCCRGYVSQTAMKEAADRMLTRGYDTKTGKVKAVRLLHLGDHDPSGLDMTRDIEDRLNMFGLEVDFRVLRIALNMEQIEEYKPPPNPAKVTDSRFEAYSQEYGDESWELDALEPAVITDLIREKVGILTEVKKQKALVKRQESDREVLNKLANDMGDEL